MNKLRNVLVSAVLILAINLIPDAASAQAQRIILINGQPTSVILSGDDITSLVSDQLTDYMKEFGQAPDDEFVRSLITLPAEIKPVDSQLTFEKASEAELVIASDETYVAAVIKPKKIK